MELPPGGTVTFLFTDIEGSTPLWDAHPAAMGVALARHDSIVRKAIDAADGHVFSTGGDGFGAVFARAGNAVSAAVAAQRELASEPWPEAVNLRVRMGLHTGEVEERDGDYFGPPVNRAARLMGAAHGGQVVVSELTAGLLDLGAVGVELVDLGSVGLKGVVEPVHVFGLSAPDMAWIDRPLVSVQSSAGNLPRPQTELVGDLVDLQGRVARLAESRLVTLTGSGGVGKTRAAVEIGWLVVDEFVDGVWLVELAPIADPEAVIPALASVLGAQPQAGMTLIESIVDWCLGRRLLLIVDNCEHVLAPVIAIVEGVVAGCPTVTVLATSREPLGVAGEQVVRIPSLGTAAGVELFRNRSVAAGAAFDGSEDELAAIAAISDRLDGIPLAIELAAARSRSLSPRELLDRLDDRFRLLRGGGRGGLERHQTLRAAVSWSYQLLSEEQQCLFDRLSVFAGGFDLDSVEVVCASANLDEIDVIDLLGELVDKSMVLAERTGSTTRYRMLETLRQYGEDRLEDRGETVTRRDLHLAHYQRIARGLREQWCSPRQIDADDLIEREWANLRAAHGWAVTTEDFDRAIELLDGVLWHAGTRLRHEASDWVNRTLELGEHLGRADSELYSAVASWALSGSEPERVLEFAQRGLEIADTDWETAIALAFVRYGAAFCGRPDVMPVAEVRAALARMSGPVERFLLRRVLLDTSPGVDSADDVDDLLAAAQAIGAPALVADALRTHGQLLLLATSPPALDQAIDDFRAAIDLAGPAGAVITEAWARTMLATSMVDGGRDTASEELRDAIAWCEDVRYSLAVIFGLEVASDDFAQQRDTEPAAVLLGFAELQPPAYPTLAERRARTRAALADTADLDRLLATGAAMTRHEAVAYALAHLSGAGPDSMANAERSG